MALDGYDSTEDRCLASCARDPVSFSTCVFPCLLNLMVPEMQGSGLWYGRRTKGVHLRILRDAGPEVIFIADALFLEIH